MQACHGDWKENVVKQFSELVRKGIPSGQNMDIGFDYHYQLKAAQMVVAIRQAVTRRLEGKAMHAHIRTGFVIYWKGVAV